MISTLVSFESKMKGAGLSRWATAGDSPLLVGLVSSLTRLDLHDCICLWVNGAVAYLDTEGAKRDLAFGVMQARDKTDGAPPGKVRLVLNQERELHSVIDILAVDDGGFAIDLAVSSRVPALRPRPGELAGEYLSRIRRAASDGSTFAHALEQHARLIQRLVSELSSAGGCSVKDQETHHLWIRPNVEEMTWFRSLRFGSEVVPPRYRPRPAKHSRSAYKDPFCLYYFDPYHMLLEWALVEALHEGEYTGPEPAVVDASGELLYGAAGAREAGSLWLGRKAVAASSDGRSLVLTDFIPNPDDLLPEAVAKEYGPDFVPDPGTLDDPRAWEIHADGKWLGVGGVGRGASSGYGLG